MCSIKIYEQELKLHGKSEKTIKAYSLQFKRFIKHFEDFDIRYISTDLIKSYILIMHDVFGYSAIVHSIASIEFYYSKIAKRKRFLNLPRPQKPKTIPTVLSINEIKKMIKLTINLKHRAIIETMFYHGLRRSELINIKIEHIDSENMLLLVKQSKGLKDRNIPLSEECLKTLRLYYNAYKPEEYLFNGQFKLKYSESSLANIIKQASKRAKINKNVHPHTLRHSFASYLVSIDTNLKKIQDWLGHSNIKTTEQYCHIEKENNPIKLKTAS